MTKPESDGSVTKWIEELKNGSSSAVPGVWNRYFTKLAKFADSEMAKSRCRAVAGEDVASAVLETVFRKVSVGKFPDLRDRGDLWRLLLTIAKCKVVSQNRHESRRKRGSGRVLLATDLSDFQNNAFDLNSIADGEPTMDSMSTLMDSCNYLIEDVLRDEKSREIAILKLEGLTNAEIAVKMNVVTRTIERKINLIRSLWAKELGIDLEGGSDDQDTVG